MEKPKKGGRKRGKSSPDAGAAPDDEDEKPTKRLAPKEEKDDEASEGRSEARGKADEATGAESERGDYSRTAQKLLRKLRKTLVQEPTGEIMLQDKYLRLLGRIGDRAVLPLKDGLKDPRWEARYSAAAALHYLARKRYSSKVGLALAELLETVRDEQPQVRAKAIEALGTQKEQREEIVPALIRALGDKSSDVSRAAVMQIIELSKDRRRTAKLMLKVLEKRKNELARMGALMVLFHLGKDARDAVPQLLPLLEDESPEIREYAHLALMGIRTPSMRLEIIRTSSMRLKVADEANSASEPAAVSPDYDSLEEVSTPKKKRKGEESEEEAEEEDDEDSDDDADEDEEDDDEDEASRGSEEAPARRGPRKPRRGARRRGTRRRR